MVTVMKVLFFLVIVLILLFSFALGIGYKDWL